MQRVVVRCLALLVVAAMVPALAGSAATAPPAAGPARGAVSASAAQVAASAPTGLPVGARALGPTKSFDKPFRRTWRRYLPRLDRCVHITVSGRMKGTREKFVRRGGYGNQWTNVRIVAPRISSRVQDYYPGPPGPECYGKKRVRNFKLVQRWKVKRCRVKVTSISVGFPWTISAGFGCAADNKTGGLDPAGTSKEPGGTYASRGYRGVSLRFARLQDGGEVPYTVKVHANVRVWVKRGSGTRSQLVHGYGSVSLPGG